MNKSKIKAGRDLKEEIIKDVLERAFPQVQPEQAAKLRIYPMSIEPRAELPGNMREYYHLQKYKSMNMADNQSNEIWVFLSHSNKDYEKVRQVRNLLENQSLRPLMFFLHCLNDDDEIDSLIKREIDCRTRFILCDSENARKSRWVQKEVEYIKSQNRICETIDLSMDINEIFAHLQEFINKTKIFISYNREQLQLAKSVYAFYSMTFPYISTRFGISTKTTIKTTTTRCVF